MNSVRIARMADDAALAQYEEAQFRRLNSSCARGIHDDEDLIPFVDAKGRTIGFEVQCLNCQETLRYISDEGF